METKLTAGGVAGAAALVLVWVAAQFGVDLPQPVANAIVVVCVFAVGWLVPSRTSTVSTGYYRNQRATDAGAGTLHLIGSVLAICVLAVLLIHLIGRLL